MGTCYQIQIIALGNFNIMSNSSHTLRTLILERIKHIQPTVDLSDYDDHGDRDLLDDFEEVLTEYIIAEQGLSAED